MEPDAKNQLVQNLVFGENLKKAVNSKFNRNPYLEGYSKVEIEDFFKDGVKTLPQIYLDFLLTMGKKAFFLDGLTYALDDLASIKQSAELVASKNEPVINLGEYDFVFLSNQGCLFALFNLKEGDNPAVYGLAEAVNQQKIEKITDSFSEFIDKMVIDEYVFDPLLTHSTFPHDVYRLEEKAKKRE